MCDNKVLPDMTGARPDSTISLVRFDPAKEMEVLRRVVLRDALLALLAEERRKFMTGGGLCLQTVLQALLETREASLQVVEAITRWRFTLVKPESFDVRGKNYALTMTTDVGFLATGLAPLKEAFGMEIGTGNPFALPCVTSSIITATASTGIGKKVQGETVRVRVPAVGSPTEKSGSSSPKGPLPGAVAGSGRKGEAGRTTSSPSARPNTTPTKLGRKRAARKDDAESVSTGDNPGGVKQAGIGEGSQPLSPSPCIEKGDGAGDVGTGKGVAGDGDDVGTGEGGVGGGDVGAGKGVVVGESSKKKSLREVLLKFGEFDAEQRERLERAQRFLEAEIARSDAKPREASWWGYHRWTARPWIPGGYLPPS